MRTPRPADLRDLVEPSRRLRIAKRAARARDPEDVVTALNARNAVENGPHGFGDVHAQLTARLGALGRNCPNRAADLGPFHAADLAATAAGQEQELKHFAEGKARQVRGINSATAAPKRLRLGVAQCPSRAVEVQGQRTRASEADRRTDAA